MTSVLLSLRSKERDDNDFCRDALIDNGLIQDFGLGRFSGYTEFEGSQMTFRYLGAGAGVETFISAIDFVTILDVDYQGVVLREVPLPGALWLLMGGLAMLRAVRRA